MIRFIKLSIGRKDIDGQLRPFAWILTYKLLRKDSQQNGKKE